MPADREDLLAAQEADEIMDHEDDDAVSDDHDHGGDPGDEFDDGGSDRNEIK